MDLRNSTSTTRAILKVWKDHREFRMQDTTFKDYEKVSAEYDGLLKEIDSRERELAKMRKDREKLAVKLGLLNARARSGISGYFGPQSPEFAQVKTSAKSHKAVRASRKPATAKSDLPPTPPPARHLQFPSTSTLNLELT